MIQKKLLLTVCICLFTAAGFTQQLPANACGIVNVYDAAGNRTKRQYFCNNGQLAYPQKIQQTEPGETMVVQTIDALYPNPTTGKFSVSFSKALENARVALTGANGKVVQQFKASGNRVEFDLSVLAAGVYLVRIEENGRVISKKVIKQ